MASSLLVRAKEAIKRNAQAARRIAVKNEKVTAHAVGAGSSLGAALVAALADQKMGKGRQWKVGGDEATGSGGVPVVALFGLGALVPAFFTGKMPIAQAASVHTGMTLLSIAGYRYLIEESVIAPGT